MGAWSGEPFGNDDAADWAGELDGEDDWGVVREVLTAAVEDGGVEDAPDGSIAVAAAETVAHGLGVPTQVDAYSTGAAAFAARAGRPPQDLVDLALAVLAAVRDEDSELAELWDEADDPEWRTALDRLEAALRSTV